VRQGIPTSHTSGSCRHRPYPTPGPLWHGHQRSSRACAGCPAPPRRSRRAPIMTSFAWQQASTLSARSCRSMMGRCGPRRARTSSSLCSPTSRKSPAARAACARARVVARRRSAARARAGAWAAPAPLPAGPQAGARAGARRVCHSIANVSERSGAGLAYGSGSPVCSALSREYGGHSARAGWPGVEGGARAPAGMHGRVQRGAYGVRARCGRGGRARAFRTCTWPGWNRSNAPSM